MSFVAFLSGIEMGLLYSMVALGLFVSFRILDIADLTVDGSFTLGAACSAMFTISGHPILGIIVAVMAGILAGMVTAILQTKLKVQPILAGILTMTGLYSINLMVMSGKSNVPLLGYDTIFSKLKPILGTYHGIIIGVIITVVVGIALYLFLGTSLGLSIRATGDNEDMVRSSSINVDFTKIVGLALANALVAASGALVAQKQGFADITTGTGMVVIGIASLIIGEVVCMKKSIPANIIAATVGSVIYRLVIALAVAINISASSMKLVSAIIVGIAISYPVIKDAILLQMKIRRSRRDANNQSLKQNL